MARPEGDNRKKPDITNLANSKTALNIQDCLEIGKICLMVVDYQNRSAIKTFSHYMDVPAAKVLFETVMRGQFTQAFPQGYQEFKGSSNGPDGKPESRVLQITAETGGKFRYGISLLKGEGRETDTGAIVPVGPQEKLFVSVAPFDMKKIAVTTLDYIRAHEIAQAVIKLQNQQREQGDKTIGGNR